MIRISSKKKAKDTDNVCAGVAWNFKPEPMLAAAVICTAHPQSIEATPEIFPIVLQSALHIEINTDGRFESWSTYRRLSTLENASILETRT